MQKIPNIQNNIKQLNTKQEWSQHNISRQTTEYWHQNNFVLAKNKLRQRNVIETPETNQYIDNHPLESYWKHFQEKVLGKLNF